MSLIVHARTHDAENFLTITLQHARFFGFFVHNYSIPVLFSIILPPEHYKMRIVQKIKLDNHKSPSL